MVNTIFKTQKKIKQNSGFWNAVPIRLTITDVRSNKAPSLCEYQFHWFDD
jgi:hypothetical protein